MNGRNINNKITKNENKIRYLKSISQYLLITDIVSFTIHKILKFIYHSEYIINTLQLITIYTLTVLLLYSLHSKKTKLLIISNIIYLTLGLFIFFFHIFYDLEDFQIIIFLFNIISGIARIIAGIFMLILYKSMSKIEKCKIL